MLNNMMDRNKLANKNSVAWNSNSYAAWVRLYGTPAEVAQKLQADPQFKLRRVINHLPALNGLTIANPLGSHGRIATALALLGSKVTVFDISESNAQYGLELCAAAGVEIDYVLGEFQSTALAHKGVFDAVVMELGIIHYFADIAHFVTAVRSLICEHGVVVLNEFHPLLAKSISINSGDISLKGDYFYSSSQTARTPFEDFIDDDVPTCEIRLWNLGEIVTAFAAGGFRIQQLVEHPSIHHAQLPGSFTLVATSD